MGQPAVYWTNTSNALKADVVKFKNCVFEFLVTALRCDQTRAPASLSTEFLFESCDFQYLDSGLIVDGLTNLGNLEFNQSNNWKFLNCNFKSTTNHAVFVTYGKDMLFKECDFKSVGTDENGTYISPAAVFRQGRNNLMLDCTSDRQSSLGITNSDEVAFIPEVYGADEVTFLTKSYAAIRDFTDPTPIAVFSSLNDFIELDYQIKFEMGDIRTGKIKIQVNNNLPGGLTFSDDYSYVSPPGRAWGTQQDLVLRISKVDYGRLYVGATIAGVGQDRGYITSGTKINFVPEDRNINTQASDYYTVDRLPVRSPTANEPQPLTFIRDTVTNVVFDVTLVNNDDSSSDVETIVLTYKQLYGNPPSIPLNTLRSSPGIMSFDVRYGTLSV